MGRGQEDGSSAAGDVETDGEGTTGRGDGNGDGDGLDSGDKGATAAVETGEGLPEASETGTGRKNAGFNRSIVTVIGFPRFRSTNVLSVRLRTLYGPSYGGTNGLLTASTRRKTWEAPERAGSTREDWEPWWITGRGREEAMIPCNSEAKLAGSGTGPDTTGSTRGPGRRRGDP